MKANLALLALWLTAAAATLFFTRQTDTFAYLAPVFFICMVGSLKVLDLVRQANKTA